MAEFSATVDQEGYAHWSLKCDRYDLHEEDLPISPKRERKKEPFQNLRDVHFKAYYFNQAELPKQVRGRVGRKLRDSGGIRLYRNDFRVLPYGEKYDDWLRLDATHSARSFLPPFSTNNFMGFVQVTDPEGTHFEETSAREGLVENPAFEELRDFLDMVLRAGVLLITAARGTKALAHKRKPERTDPVDRAKDLAERASQLDVDRGVQESRASEAQEVAKGIMELGNEVKGLINEIAMLRVLASLGLSIGEFTHEVTMAFGTLRAESANLEDEVGHESEAGGRVRDFRKRLGQLQSYVMYFDEAARDNTSREVEVQEVRDVLLRFVKSLLPQLERLGIELDGPHFSDDDLFARPMHPSEWSSILLNVVTNATKAIRRANVSGKILLQARREDDEIIIEVADNGDGVPSQYEERIFDAFFTTTGPSSPFSGATKQLVGMGLGLKITRDILDSAGGYIHIAAPPDGYSTCFRLGVPAATEDEIPDDAY